MCSDFNDFSSNGKRFHAKDAAGGAESVSYLEPHSDEAEAGEEEFHKQPYGECRNCCAFPYAREMGNEHPGSECGTGDKRKIETDLDEPELFFESG